MRNLVYLSLGSNLGDREQELRSAIARLHSDEVGVLRVSSIYETEPMYLHEQPGFLNIVAEAETTLPPMRLLLRIKELERRMGRRRTVRNGPRNIDIDILLFAQQRVAKPRLQIPHPRMQERRFVLEPLAELAPELRHPVSGQTIRELLRSAPDQNIRAIQPLRPTLPAGTLPSAS